MKEKTYSESIANAINNFLTEDGWHFSFDELRSQFRFGLSLKEIIKNVSFIIVVKENNFTVYAISPVGADPKDEKMMLAMGEFVCRANYGTKNGSFEFDWRDGELRYKSFCDCEGIESPSREMIKNSIYCSAGAFIRYGIGITEIIFLHSTAREAITECEENFLEACCTSIIGSGEQSEDQKTMIAHLASLGFEIGDDVPVESSEDGSDGEGDDEEDGEMNVVLEMFKPKGDAD